MSQFTIYGFTWQGTWGNSTTYNVYDTVQRNGSLYNCVASNINIDPATDDGTHWQLAASKGDAGPSGASDISVVGGVYTSNATIIEKSGTIIVKYPSVLGAWQLGHAYSLGALILDGFGQVQQVTTAGTSSNAGQPFSLTTSGQTTNDGSVVWTNIEVAKRILTLPTLTSGTDDGKILRIIGLDQCQHVIGAPSGTLFNGDTAQYVRFSTNSSGQRVAAKGTTVTLEAYAGYWYVIWIDPNMSYA